MRARKDGFMIDKLGSYLASRPRKTAVLVLTLAVAFILVLAGLALELSHFGEAPYPSESIDLGFSLVDGNVLLTEQYSYFFENHTSNKRESLCPYAGAKVAFLIERSGIVGLPFGNSSILSTGVSATMTQRLLDGTFNATIDITDSTGNGAFDAGDTILFRVLFHSAPMPEDTVCTIGLAYFPEGNYASVYTEMSFAIHDGKVYSWLSDNLSTEGPWFGP